MKLKLMRLLYTIILALFITPVCAQSLSPSVIASAGSSFTSAQFSMDYTLGETFVTTLSNGSNILTQGFHQPQAGVIVEGCTAVEACNYNQDATIDDGTCELPGFPCDDANASTVDDFLNADCICEGLLSGCSAAAACNYNLDAIIDDVSKSYN
jgi:hypothetical protein